MTEKCKRCDMEMAGESDYGRHLSPEHCIEALSSRVEELEAQVLALVPGPFDVTVGGERKVKGKEGRDEF